MASYVPTHGLDCETRTYRTRCSDCRETVFFFSCSCQSAVFFDSLGHPWPEHVCTKRRYSELRALGHSAEDARFQILIDARHHGRSIPDHISESMERDAKAEKARRSSPRSPRRTLYREILPDEPRDFPGRVMGIDRNINMPRQFG